MGIYTEHTYIYLKCTDRHQKMQTWSRCPNRHTRQTTGSADLSKSVQVHGQADRQTRDNTGFKSYDDRQRLWADLRAVRGFRKAEQIVKTCCQVGT